MNKIAMLRYQCLMMACGTILPINFSIFLGILSGIQTNLVRLVDERFWTERVFWSKRDNAHLPVFTHLILVIQFYTLKKLKHRE